MTASGQATKTRTRNEHVCKPPPGFAAQSGLLWICPDCWSEFIFRPVAPRELGGRVINMWVRHWDPKGNGWVPLDRRRRHKRKES